MAGLGAERTPQLAQFGYNEGYLIMGIS
jgi:hypothetical protein